jgi:hypothetical protein
MIPLLNHVGTPFRDCAMVGRVIYGFCALSISFTSLLFLFRIRAIYLNKTIIVAVFCVLWLAVPAANVTLVLGTGVSRLENSPYCKVDRIETWVAASLGSLMIFDTLVFIAVTWKLMNMSHFTYRDGASYLQKALGTYLPTFSKALLRDGQRYYA